MNITINGVELAIKCFHCQGYGWVGDDENPSECGECAGLGSHFTEDGNRLATFIRLVAKAASS